jgi:hypothetical protein
MLSNESNTHLHYFHPYICINKYLKPPWFMVILDEHRCLKPASAWMPFNCLINSTIFVFFSINVHVCFRKVLLYDVLLSHRNISGFQIWKTISIDFGGLRLARVKRAMRFGNITIQSVKRRKHRCKYLVPRQWWNRMEFVRI